MNFFEHQDQARRNSGWLVVLFSIAVLMLIAITNVFIAFTLHFFNNEAGNTVSVNSGGAFDIGHYLSWGLLGWTSAIVIGTIACVIVFKWAALSGGGKRVAESLGGRRIAPNTTDSDERRVLNVVEEMAIAAGLPVPPVYLLPDESGINAFAAGISPADAVIGITQGAIQTFDREQLQGVVAHEFSHILNGDMRLNIRLIAVLAGILFIGQVGEFCLRGSRHGSRRSSGFAMVGLGLVIIGLLGTFFGNLIKAAVSRQREFLADASAVQYTRNPDGISGALQLIGGYSAGSRVEHSHAEEMSHLFFGQAISNLASFFATHPPLAERIRRVDPSWNGNFPERSASDKPERSPWKEQLRGFAPGGEGIAAGAQAAPLDVVEEAIERLPIAINEAVHEPFSAMALVFCFLLDDANASRIKQLKYIEQTGFRGLDRQVLSLLPELEKLAPRQRLPLVDMALPALRCLSPAQYPVFKRTLLLLVRADQRTDLHEWCLYQIITRALEAEFGKVRAPIAAFKQADQVGTEYQLVLSLLAWQGANDEEQAKAAFSRGANTVGLYTQALLPLQDCQLDAFSQAVNKLANCYPLLKPRLLKGLRDCASHDNYVDPQELELITAIAAVMDAPMPRFA